MTRILRVGGLALLLAVVPSACTTHTAEPAPPAAAPIAPAAAPAEAPAAEDLAAIHRQLEAEKRSIVAQYMQLSDAEAAKFWPVYEAYQADLAKIHERMRILLEGYAADYRDDTLTDAKAKVLLDAWLAVERDDAALRGSYAPRVMEALPIKKAARYLQIENEFKLMMKYELAATVPLVP